MLALAALLGGYGFHVPTGYYSLADLSTLLGKQGLRIEVAAPCSNELFALRMEHLSVDGLSSALESTRRLQVERMEGGLRISLSATYAAQASADLNRYVEADLGDVLLPSQDAAKEIAKLTKFSEYSDVEREVTDYVLAKQKTKNPVDKAAGDLVVRWMTYQDFLYMGVNLPPLLLANGWKGIGEFHMLRVEDSPDVFYPAGYKEKTRPFDWNTLRDMRPPNDLVGVKIRFEPVTGGALLPIFLTYTAGRTDFGPSGWPMPLRQSWVGPPKPEDVLSAEDFKDYRARLSATSAVLAGCHGDTVAKAPQGPRHVSEVLLALADAADQDLVEYVSPLWDRKISVEGETSLSKVFAQVNRGEFDKEFDARTLMERMGPRKGILPNTPGPWASISAIKAEGTLVVRTETDFMDLLVEGPVDLSSELLNREGKGTHPPLEQLLAAVAGLRLDRWRGSTFSSRFLDHTNPVGLFPFASLLSRSSDLLKRVTSLGRGQSFESRL